MTGSASLCSDITIFYHQQVVARLSSYKMNECVPLTDGPAWALFHVSMGICGNSHSCLPSHFMFLCLFLGNGRDLAWDTYASHWYVRLWETDIVKSFMVMSDMVCHQY